MGAWGMAPWENDGAADWFIDAIVNSELPAKVEAALMLDAEVYHEDIRAAAYVLLSLGRNFIWPVVARAAVHDVVPATAIDVGVARPGPDVVVARPAADVVVPGPAEDPVVARPAADVVVAGAAFERQALVDAGIDDDAVIAGPALDDQVLGLFGGEIRAIWEVSCTSGVAQRSPSADLATHPRLREQRLPCVRTVS
jgi:hypothetical protein